MWLKAACICILVWSAFGCNHQQPVPTSILSEKEKNHSITMDWKQFHIPEGRQFPTENEADFIKVKSLTKYVRFDDSARINTTEINKLFGTSDCNDWTHTDSSARWGWRYNEGTSKIELFAYVEYQGNHLYQHNFTPDAVIDLNQTAKLSMVMKKSGPNSYPSSLFSTNLNGSPIVGSHRDPQTGDAVFETTLGTAFPGSYDFFINDKKVNTLPRVCNRELAEGPELLPFFGGVNRVAPHEIIIQIAPN